MWLAYGMSRADDGSTPSYVEQLEQRMLRLEATLKRVCLVEATFNLLVTLIILATSRRGLRGNCGACH